MKYKIKTHYAEYPEVTIEFSPFDPTFAVIRVGESEIDCRDIPRESRVYRNRKEITMGYAKAWVHCRLQSMGMGQATRVQFNGWKAVRLPG